MIALLWMLACAGPDGETGFDVREPCVEHAPFDEARSWSYAGKAGADTLTVQAYDYWRGAPVRVCICAR